MKAYKHEIKTENYQPKLEKYDLLMIDKEKDKYGILKLLLAMDKVINEFDYKGFYNKYSLNEL